MKKKAKKIGIALLGIGIASAAVILPQDSDSVSDRKIEIHVEQEKYKEKNNKYKQYLKEKIDDTDITVTEYVGSKGAGYQITTKKETEDSIIMTSIDSGAEPHRNFTIIIPKTENPETTTAQSL